MSALRAFAIPKTSVTNVVTPHTLSYYDSEESDYLPIPFTTVNGVLDIAVQDNVTADLLTPASFDGEIGSNDYQASIMGGLSPVSSLGPNMLTFLKNFIAYDESGDATDFALVTDIEIYNAPTMTKIRFNHIRDENTYQFDTVAPVKTTPDPVSGNSSNNYRVVSIFKSPLVVSFKYDGSDTKYLTFTSTFDSI